MKQPKNTLILTLDQWYKIYQTAFSNTQNERMKPEIVITMSGPYTFVVQPSDVNADAYFFKV